MKVIIVGCGKVGETLAAELNEEGNDITVVDMQADIVADVSAKCDVMGVVGNGATHSVQLEAGVDEADLLIAVTGSDELNLLCCMVAKMNGRCQTIARVRNPEYSAESAHLKDVLGLAMVINPEQATAEEIARVLRFPSAIKIETFAKNRVELLKFRLPENSILVGMSVKDIVMKLKCDILVCTVEREDGAHIANGDLVFEGRDVISLIASPKHVNEFFGKIRYKTQSVKDAILLGGGAVSSYLCSALQKTGISVKIIESCEKTCSRLSDTFPTACVIRSETFDKEMLLAEGLEGAGALVALTKKDEENILLSLYAKGVTKGKVVTEIRRTDYDDVIKHLDLDTVVYPEIITADIILRHVRAMKDTTGSDMETLYSVVKDKIEATEFIVKENAPLIGQPLSTMTFKKNILIAAILRGQKVIIPRGYDTIEAGDAVVIVSEAAAVHDIADILG